MQISQIPTSAQANLNAPSQSASSSFGNAIGVNNNTQYADNANLMNIANAFNNYQSSTAYQRTVKDMESAGINPTIAFGLGKGQLDSSLQSAQATTSSNSGKLGSSILGTLGSMLKLLMFL